MIPASFDYVRASSVQEAISLLVAYGDDVKLLAGGHSLLPLMKLRLATPSVLVDLGPLSELSYVRDGGDHLAIGALTRHRDLEVSELLRDQVPVLAHVAAQVGDPQVRHRGTIGGSLAHADPASDLPAVILALGGALVAMGPDGERTIEATQFWQGFLETALRPDEVLTEVRVPKGVASQAGFGGRRHSEAGSGGRGWSFQKLNRRAQDWATVGVVAVSNGYTAVSLINMASTPVRATAVEEALAGGATAAEAAALASDGLNPPDDLNASSGFRRHLATVLVRRALEEVAS